MFYCSRVSINTTTACFFCFFFNSLKRVGSVISSFKIKLYDVLSRYTARTWGNESRCCYKRWEILRKIETFIKKRQIFTISGYILNDSSAPKNICWPCVTVSYHDEYSIRHAIKPQKLLSFCLVPRVRMNYGWERVLEVKAVTSWHYDMIPKKKVQHGEKL